MPSHPPDEITDEREQTLWRDLSRLFEDYCASDPTQWPERERSFVRVLNLIKDKVENDLP